MMIANKNNLLKIAIVLAFFAFVAKNSFADDKMKIAVVNMAKLEQTSLASKDLQEKMKKKERELQQVLISRKQKIENDFKSLEAKRATLSGSELQSKAKKLESDYQSLQFDERVYAQTFEEARIIALREIQENVGKVVNKIATKKNYDAVLPSNMFIYLNDDKFIDITKEVIDKTNDAIKSVDYNSAFKEAKKTIDRILAEQAKTGNKKK